MKRLLQNVPFDVALIFIAYQGFFNNHTIMHNIAYFALWFVAIIGTFLLIPRVYDEVLMKQMKRGKRSTLFKWWDIATDVVYVTLPVAAGMWVLGIFLTIATLMKQNISQQVDKESTHGSETEEQPEVRTQRQAQPQHGDVSDGQQDGGEQTQGHRESGRSAQG